jgi:hypothetical protein
MLLPTLLVSLALLAEPKARCAPEGLYRADAGFFTRFDGQGRWETMTALGTAPQLAGRYDVDRDQIRFKLSSDGETPYDWVARFSEDCNAIVLSYLKGTSPEIRFTRVVSPRR